MDEKLSAGGGGSMSKFKIIAISVILLLSVQNSVKLAYPGFFIFIHHASKSLFMQFPDLLCSEPFKTAVNQKPKVVA